MGKKGNFGNDWPKLRKQLLGVSQEALQLAKRGEEQLTKFAHQGKLHIDKAAVSVHKEQLYYSIGREYVKAKAPSTPTPALKKLLDKLSGLEKDAKVLQRKIKSGA